LKLGGRARGDFDALVEVEFEVELEAELDFPALDEVVLDRVLRKDAVLAETGWEEVTFEEEEDALLLETGEADGGEGGVEGVAFGKEEVVLFGEYFKVDASLERSGDERAEEEDEGAEEEEDEGAEEDDDGNGNGDLNVVSSFELALNAMRLKGAVTRVSAVGFASIDESLEIAPPDLPFVIG